MILYNRHIATFALFLMLFLPIYAQSDIDEQQFIESKGIEIIEGNSVKLLTNGHEKFVDMFEAIRNAKQFVHLEYFNYSNDSIAGLLFHLLAEKVKEGVEVRALYDAYGNATTQHPIKHAMHDSIRNLGIDLVQFDPIKFPWGNHLFHRDHRKIVVVDGEIAYTGGMNVADNYINGLEDLGSWHDMHMHIEGEAVNELHKVFCQMWAEVTGEILVSSKYFPKQETKGDVKMAIIDRHPRTTNKAIRELCISMLDNAETSVKIVNPYFAPTKKVRDALKRCIDRGVKVEIMISEKGDLPIHPPTDHHVGRNLQKRGATVYVFQNGFHHTKLMIIDDKFCTVGSANLNSRSLRCDHEVTSLIFDQEVTNQLIDIFVRDEQECIKMSDEYWKKQSIWKKFMGWFGNCFTLFI